MSKVKKEETEKLFPYLTFQGSLVKRLQEIIDDIEEYERWIRQRKDKIIEALRNM